jgi:L-threonylcarbamoyladenylate synthase
VTPPPLGPARPGARDDPPLPTELLDGSPASIARAAAVLRGGGLVAFPTETVYGLGARADDPRAVAEIYRVKGRPADKPLIVHVASVEQARRFVARWPARAEALARAFWPGPLTLVLPRAFSVPDAVTARGETVAVRAPAHPVAIALLEACGFALAAPSANRAGAPAPTSAAEVLRALGGAIPLVLDGGSCGTGAPSTIVDLGTATDELVLLREGALSRAAIARVWRAASTAR